MSYEHSSAEELQAKIYEEHLALADAIGIPFDCSPSQLLYVPSATTLIAEVCYRSTPAREHRLFARRCSERRYTLVGQPAEGTHYQQPVANFSSRYVYFSVWSTSSLTGEGSGSNWESIQRLDLSDYRVEQVVAAGKLIVPAPYTHAWVSQLESVCASGTSLVCVCGLQRPTGEHSSQVDYVLCDLDLASHNVTPITKLEGIWF